MDGRFHLEIMEGSATALVISFVGYQEEEVNIAGKGDMADIVVKLTAMSIEMEDVVVTGMAPRKVSGFTGRYVTVKGDQLKKLNPNNLLQELQLFDRVSASWKTIRQVPPLTHCLNSVCAETSSWARELPVPVQISRC